MTGLCIVADENMPLVEELFSPLGEVRRLPGRNMQAADLAGADVLLVRSVTRVDAALLGGSAVRFVGSATIGVDHVDLAYLAAQGIGFASAPGCNARSVAEYVLAALLAQAQHVGPLGRLRVGVVGCGAVGSALCRLMSAAGAAVVAHDPLLPPASSPFLGELERVLAADAICLHAPLTRTGPHPTQHMFDARALARLSSRQLLLNAGRGGVIDNQALLQRLQRPDAPRVVLDVWENEPSIDTRLLERVAIATPHIAGYSLDGKQAGTRQVYEAVCRFFGLVPSPPERREACLEIRLRPGDSDEEAVQRAVRASYDIMADDARMRGELLGAENVSEAFDSLRKLYPVRREFAAHRISGGEALSPTARARLKALGFLLG